MRRLGTAAMAGIAVLAVMWPRRDRPSLLWNASPSVPVGLYRLIPPMPEKGELAVIRLPGPVRRLAAERGYLDARALLVKPVGAGPGDVVCRQGLVITVNGHVVARARRQDGQGRPLPRWNGCLTLTVRQVLVLSMAPDSFDGRYFGPIDATHVIGTARAVWTTETTRP